MKKTIIKKKFWNLIKNSGTEKSNASNLRFSKKSITDIIINKNTSVSRSAREL